jgi:hypothetical protein
MAKARELGVAENMEILGDSSNLNLIFYTSDQSMPLKRLISLDRVDRNHKNVVPRSV